MYVEQADKRHEREFERQVLAVNLGTAIYHDRKAHNDWRRKVARRDAAERPVGASGAALEAQVMALALTNPDLVAVRVGA